MRLGFQKLNLMLVDALLLNAAVALAFIVRFEGLTPYRYIIQYETLWLLFTSTSVLVFYLCGYYSSLWRYAGLYELFVIVRGTLLSTSLFTAYAVVFPWLGQKSGITWLVQPGFPRSVIVLTGLFTTLLLGGLRFSFRYAFQLGERLRRKVDPVRTTSFSSKRRVLIVGAGNMGASLAETLQRNKTHYKVLGFIDDDMSKQGMNIHGIPVIGTRADFTSLAARLEIQEVIIAVPNVQSNLIQDLMNAIKPGTLSIKILPSMYEVLNGTVSLHHLRDIQIEDLLRREPVMIDLQEIAGYLEGRRVLITGAGGSIGSELSRQVSRFAPASVLLLDSSENGVHEALLDLELLFPSKRYLPIIADIRDSHKIFRVFATYKPEVVFHAAAYKHVHLMEEHPDEAVMTNVFGTWNLVEAAAQNQVQQFVLVSTDKAVNPVSVMGATKRVAELIVQAYGRTTAPQHSTRFTAVRFGNVLGSRGSVVPTFMRQIARGGPVTVTHADMSRYFMTITEAAALVVQAGALAQNGEVFVLDMGDPIRIHDLAENLIRLSGFEPGVDIPIVYTNPRRGEKLHEELLTREESSEATRHKHIYVGRIPTVDITNITHLVADLRVAVQTSRRPDELARLLYQLIPELTFGVEKLHGLANTGQQ